MYEADTAGREAFSRCERDTDRVYLTYDTDRQWVCEGEDMI